MKSKYNIGVTALFLFLAISCGTNSVNNDSKTDGDTSENKQSSLQQFDWLCGNWVDINDEFEFYESWKTDKTDYLSGYSFMMIDNDTVFEEYITLMEKDDGKIYYIVSFTGENDASAVAFELISVEDNTWHFYNPTNDFPQSIVYRYVAPDSVYAHISGKMGQDEFSREDFVMVRKK